MKVPILLNLWGIFYNLSYGIKPNYVIIKDYDDIRSMNEQLEEKGGDYVISEHTFTPLLHAKLLYIEV